MTNTILIMNSVYHLALICVDGHYIDLNHVDFIAVRHPP
jgi:hypothetical protein